MSTQEIIFLTILLILVLIGFIGWLGIKYDLVGRDNKIKELEVEIKKLKDKEERRKKRIAKKKKEETSMNGEIISLETAKHIKSLERENQVLNDMVISFDNEVNRLFKIIKEIDKIAKNQNNNEVLSVVNKAFSSNNQNA